MNKKDKRAEKEAETEEDKLEYRTDGSEAFDTLCHTGVELHLQGVTVYVDLALASEVEETNNKSKELKKEGN